MHPIAEVRPWLLVGDGASIHTRRLARALVGAGVETHVATMDGEPMADIEWHSIGTGRVESDWKYLPAIPRLSGIIRRLQPRVINAHYLSSYGLMASLAHRIAPSSAVLIQTLWGSDVLVTARHSRARRSLARWALANSDLVSGDSDELLGEAGALAPQKPRHPFVFGPPESLLSTTVQKERLIVTTRSHLPEMRLDLAIRGFLAAKAALPDWKLVIAASGPETDNLKALAGVDEGISFVGDLALVDMHSLMLRGRLLVSVPTTDGTSAALLEGLAAGMRPVVNDLPANRQWVSPEFGAIVSRNPVPGEVAEAIIQVANTAQTLDPRSTVMNFTLEAEVERLIARAAALRSN